MVDGGDENLNAVGQEEPADEDVGRIAGEGETEESKANGETGKNLDGAIAHRASGEDGDTEASGVYEFKDNKTTGTVTVVKKWDDQSNNAERPVVDVNLSTAKPSKNPLGYTVTFHADVEKGLTFADGSTENDVVYNSSGQVISGAYQGLTDGSGVVRWYTDKTYQTQIGLNADGTLTAPLTGDVDVWPKKVTFAVKGYDSSTYKNGFNQAITNTVTTIVFTDEAMPADATFIDVDADGDGGVVAWTEENRTVMKVSTQIAGVKVQAANNSINMFNYKSNIQTVDFTNLDTSQVKYMGDMFSDCSGLTSLDLLSFDTANVSSMVSMFSGCSGLTSLDLSQLDTSKVTSMSSMFSGCSRLTSLDLSQLDTSKVTNMSSMFSGCSSLTSLDLSSFDTANVSFMGDMFRGCSGLTSLNLLSFDTASVSYMGYMFNDCSGLANLDLSSLDTSKVTSMSSMFRGCSGLTSLDLSSFDTANVKNMGTMFYNCSSLTSLDLSPLDTSKVTSMGSMFSGCSGLTSLDLSSFDTANVTSMYYMFQGCSGLTNLDLSSFDTANVTSMYCMFQGCSGLTSLDLSSFDTTNVKNMDSLFSGCSGLTTITTSANFRFVGTSYNLPGTWQNTAGETFTSGNFPSNVADTYTRVS